MTTITGVNHPLFPNRTSIQAADAAQTAEQILNSYYATSAGGGSAQIDTGANALTGSSGTPPLSSDVVGALINDQAQQAATNSASAASGAEKGAASTGTAAPPSGSAPLTLQMTLASFSPPFFSPASMYTIMQTAKLNGVNPEAYLRDTLTKIADGHPISRIDELMPWQSL